MGRVIAFSEFESYFESFSGPVSGTILDTNILISLTYEIKSDFDEIIAFVDGLLDADFKLYTTVNTKSEFLDFHRRLFMTEHLIDMVTPESTWKISKAARAQIQSQIGQLRRSEKHGSDPVFSDRQIKKIKSAFSAGSHSGQQGWAYSLTPPGVYIPQIHESATPKEMLLGEWTEEKITEMKQNNGQAQLARRKISKITLCKKCVA